MSAIPEIPSEPVHPESWPAHPRKKMLMTPLMATVGAMLAFSTVVFMVVFLPTTTFEPPPSDNWRPLNTQEMAGRDVFLSNGCIYCHSGFSRPQDVLASQYYLYPRVSEPGDYSGKGETPNLFGTIRTGPDLSQAGGFHPDDWHYAHYHNARYTTPISVMPSFSFLSKEELLALTAFTQARGGKAADIRSQHQQAMKALEFASDNVAAQGENGDRSDGYPAASAIKNLMLIERGYWFADNPLPVTKENLLRGRQVFQERCIGCHGSQGNGNGPAAFYFNPPPAAFDVADDQMHGSDTSPGAYYWRILRGVPGTAMENFGTRLSVDDIWKVVLFLKTIANGGLTVEVPTPDLYIRWQGYPEIFKWAQCFYPAEAHFASAKPDTGIPAPGLGDVPGIVNEGQVNPVYAVVLWEVNNNARPCGSKGSENVGLQNILTQAGQRNDGYARQGADQMSFIPASMLDQSMMPPQFLEQVWDKPNPLIEPGAGNK
jgi:cytochrome c oxidase cbb3-type subunit 2